MACCPTFAAPHCGILCLIPRLCLARIVSCATYTTRVTAASDQSKKSPSNSRENRVPSSRTERLASFAGLFAGLGMGAAAEVVRRTFNDDIHSNSSVFLTNANIDRMVKTLCTVRGAALKIGQMLSIQDNELVSQQVQDAFRRVRQDADYMPVFQTENMLKKELGSNWKDKFKTFDMSPFAAASIGQVHRAFLVPNEALAVKIQYPGVANSIHSDIANLMGVMRIADIIPKGAFMENLVRVMRVELGWECDYVREAHCANRFRDLLKSDSCFYIPKLYENLSSRRILTAEFVNGVPVDEVISGNKKFDQETRDWIGEKILGLCLRELFEFRFMQTDPNWANFFYDSSTNRINLLDFGASREYSKHFVDDYLNLIKANMSGDVSKVLELSIKTGFLTGKENDEMKDAHLQAIAILGEAFVSTNGDRFDFGKQSTTSRIYKLLPIMLKYRLSPPPDESYSLHRKLSGCFLLCARLGSRVNCRQIFEDATSNRA